MTLARPGTTVRFQLHISGIDLGDFTACSGLGARVEVERRPEGGDDAYARPVPGRITYPNVTLSRRLTPDTAKVSRFLAKLPDQLARSSAQITAVTPAAPAASGPVLATWALREVTVVRWTGPSYDPARSEAATESIELAHHGFL